MELRLLEFADYATTTSEGKMIVSGIFNRLIVKTKGEAPPGTPLAYPMPAGVQFCWIISASLRDGLKHQVSVIVRNEDGKEVLKSNLDPMEFNLDPQGRPMLFFGRLAVGGVPLPGAGDYEFELYVNGEKLGVCPLYVDVMPVTG